MRIGPNEVHINDSQFYEVLYSQSRPANKLESLVYRFNSPLSVFSAVDHGLHRQRRAALNPLFSKQKVTSQSPFIQRHMDKLCDRISREFSNSGEILVLNKMWACFTCDIIVEYCFGMNYQLIDRPGWKHSFTTAMIDLLDGVHFVTQFPLMLTLINSLPDSVAKKLDPAMASVIDYDNVRTSAMSRPSRADC